MTTLVHYDEAAPKSMRWRVLRATGGQTDEEPRAGSWITVESFGTERDAKRFAEGFTLGSAYVAAPLPLDDRADASLRLVKLARDDYKRECRELRADLAAIKAAQPTTTIPRKGD